MQIIPENAPHTCDVLVVGNGMVGHHFVVQLQAQAPDKKITVLSGESRLAYDRVHLSEFFSGKTSDDLALTTTAQYDDMSVDYVLNAWVSEIDKENKTVTTQDGYIFSYEALVLATGSYPFVPLSLAMTKRIVWCIALLTIYTLSRHLRQKVALAWSSVAVC